MAAMQVSLEEEISAFFTGVLLYNVLIIKGRAKILRLCHFL
jgi:hypothetical protein